MECGECTACCTLSVVKELQKEAWVKCDLCKDNKCSIYGKHPKSCKDFECAYLQGGSSIDLRPDKCGVMFVKKSDRIFCGILVPNVPVSDMAKSQIASFKQQGFSVVMLKKEERPHLELAEGHDEKEIYDEYLNTLVNGSI